MFSEAGWSTSWSWYEEISFNSPRWCFGVKRVMALLYRASKVKYCDYGRILGKEAALLFLYLRLEIPLQWPKQFPKNLKLLLFLINSTTSFCWRTPHHQPSWISSHTDSNCRYSKLGQWDDGTTTIRHPRGEWLWMMNANEKRTDRLRTKLLFSPRIANHGSDASAVEVCSTVGSQWQKGCKVLLQYRQDDDKDNIGFNEDLFIPWSRVRGRYTCGYRCQWIRHGEVLELS
jgi:hypothetical protein